MLTTTPTLQTRAPRAFARGPKTRTGGFLRGGEKCTRRSCVKPLKPRLVAKLPAAKTASGVLYYGFRYYNPNTGRWLSRDPIEEGDGPNVYAFVHNDAACLVDVLGMSVLAPSAAAGAASSTTWGGPYLNSPPSAGGPSNSSAVTAGAGVSAGTIGVAAGVGTAAVVGTAVIGTAVVAAIPGTITGGHYPATFGPRPATVMGPASNTSAENQRKKTSGNFSHYSPNPNIYSLASNEWVTDRGDLSFDQAVSITTGAQGVCTMYHYNVIILIEGSLRYEGVVNGMNQWQLNVSAPAIRARTLVRSSRSGYSGPF